MGFVSCLYPGKTEKTALLHSALPAVLPVKNEISLSRHVTGADKHFKLLFSYSPWKWWAF